MALDMYGAPVHNSGIDPLSGFDFQVWVQDSFSGGLAFFGAFQSLTISIRNATETYLELGSRLPIYLDGEFQIAWVIEQGLVDMSVIARTFGLNSVTRSDIIGRGPRFQIAFDANAAELSTQSASNDTAAVYRMGQRQNSIFAERGGNESVKLGLDAPTPKGRYELQRCKVDSISLGVMTGRRVAAVRWEGVAEGYRFIHDTVQEFKDGVSARQVSPPPGGLATPLQGRSAFNT